jgi:hypothetical protein
MRALPDRSRPRRLRSAPLWSATNDADQRRRLAAAGRQVRQALELAETDPDATHALVNQALASVRDRMKFHDPTIHIVNAAVDRMRRA